MELRLLVQEDGTQFGDAPPDGDASPRNSAMVILKALADEHGPVTVAELAARTTLHRASLYRNIESLADEGLVERVPGTPRRYVIGLEFVRIGLRALRHLEPRSILLPMLMELASATREACSLFFYERGETVATDSIYLPEPPFTPVAEGVRTPCHVHGMGKVMLAFQPAAEIERVLDGRLKRFTGSTITDPETLRAELQVCRANGYGFVFGEYHPGFGTVGFPVFNREGRAIASFGVRVLDPAGPPDATIAAGKAIAARASVTMGYRAGVLGFG
jgi:DNA-binding IclR family transcriptional regulator